MEKVRMSFRESELFYARLEGKFAAIDDEKDSGRFYMNIRSEKSKDTDYWNVFYDSYHEEMARMESK